MKYMIEALDIRVRGIVQGVGFRPFVYRQAMKHLIQGWVLNSVEGVTIHAEGEMKLLDEFVLALSEEHPAAAQITEIELTEVPLENFDSFEIRFSDDAAVEETTLISPDLATCVDCERELFDPEDRRYRYPFINCTNCGPRFTIINGLPYDRKLTSMKSFIQCGPCQIEYDDPLDRRFHAQPNACFDCGPSLTWDLAKNESVSDPKGSSLRHEETSDAILAEAVQYLEAGKIVAIKGLGGFHLACDAENETAVTLLRQRKKREGKPFAVMMKSIEHVKYYCEVNKEEEALLTGSQRPIVLLRKKQGVQFTRGLADGLSELGVMLPYTPVQHLLLHDFDGMLVMTSGNMHDEPIVTDDTEAKIVLGEIADAFLGNDRPICARYDDSVLRVIRVGKDTYTHQFIRRARGYAPVPMPLPLPAEKSITVSSVFATGPEQKNTFCLTRGPEAFVSQHIGDMENAETFDAWLATKADYERLFETKPSLVACDMHPEYLVTKWAHDQQLPVVEVQHHHAHIVSVMAENNLEGPVCGMAFDGTGYGADKSIWGGEVLLSNLHDFERFANFTYVPMPGGAAAIKHPARMAYGVLWAFDLLDHPAAQSILDELGATAQVCDQMIEQGINTPFTSSVGRLFDAASALLGICSEPHYEGEGAVLLEAVGAIVPSHSGDPQAEDPSYQIDIVKNVATETSTARDTSVVLLDPAPLFKALLDDKEQGVSAGVIAKRFHDGFVAAIVRVAQLVQAAYEIDTFVLSGGVFMNRYLIEHTVEALIADGFTVALNRELPPGDGCISYGQAVVALHKQ